MRVAGDRAAADPRARPGATARIRGRLGVVPQEDTLDLELTVYENLLIYGRYFGSRTEIRERADELLEFVQLSDRGGTVSTRSRAG